jgi:predicted RNase H-like HicB family nuclease
MQYPIFIHKDEASDYGVIVPDLPGCFSAGSTIEEAVNNAREAIECHLQGLLLDKDPIPLKNPIEYHLNNPDFNDAVLARVEIDLSKISAKTTKINISLPEAFLKQFNDYTHLHGVDLSGFLVDAAMNFMAEHPA